MKNIGKRLVYLVLALVLVGTLPLYANAADTFDYGLTYELSDDGTLTISGNGAMKDYGTSENWPWHGQKRNIKHVVIGCICQVKVDT